MHHDNEPVHLTVPGSATDPRLQPPAAGLVIHRTPPLHPEDVTVIDGMAVTSPSRTLIDCAEVMERGELRELFVAARANGLLDSEAMDAARARVEWRPSLAMLDEVIAEFCSRR
jgi:hypothetical protein